MISRSIKKGTTVWHEMFGFGTFNEYETKEGIYQGFAIVEFPDYPGRSVISRKKLTEIEEEQ